MREGIYNKNTFFVFVFFHFQEIACLVMFISEIQRGTFGYVKNTRNLYHYNVIMYNIITTLLCFRGRNICETIPLQRIIAVYIIAP